MTGDAHDTDALIAALRSPALPAEQVGEAAAVALMVDVHCTALSELPGRRSRRGVAVAAVTVASLGLGGLVAAGPGIFSPAADRPVVAPPPTVSSGSVEQADTSDDVPTMSPATPEADSALTPPPGAAIDDITNDDITNDDIVCASGNRGQTVSSVARDGDPATSASDAGRSDCGRNIDDPTGGIDEADGDLHGIDASGAECAGGNHGRTVSSVAQSDISDSSRGEAVSAAAQSDCGKHDPSVDEIGSVDAGQPDGFGRPDGIGRAGGPDRGPEWAAEDGSTGRPADTEPPTTPGNAVNDAAKAGAGKDRP